MHREDDPPPLSATVNGTQRIYDVKEAEPIKLDKSNVILLGPTGSGKLFPVSYLFSCLLSPHVSCDVLIANLVNESKEVFATVDCKIKYSINSM